LLLLLAASTEANSPALELTLIPLIFTGKVGYGVPQSQSRQA
jgi:hypothetical protein